MCDSSNLTAAQQIFGVFYAIFFGIMLQTVGNRSSVDLKDKKVAMFMKKKHDATLNLFDTPNAWAIGCRGDNKPLRRLLFSIFSLNIAPGIFFAFVFVGLGNLKEELDLHSIVLIALLSLAPHYIYRVYMSFVVLLLDKLYLDPDSNTDLKDYMQYDVYAKSLIDANRKQYRAHGGFINHVAFPVFVVFPLYAVFYIYLVPGAWSIYVFRVVVGFMLTGIIYFFIIYPQIRNKK